MICGRVEAVLLTKKLKVVTVRLGLDAFGTAAEGVIRAFGENIDLSEVSFLWKAFLGDEAGKGCQK